MTDAAAPKLGPSVGGRASEHEIGHAQAIAIASVVAAAEILCKRQLGCAIVGGIMLRYVVDLIDAQLLVRQHTHESPDRHLGGNVVASVRRQCLRH